jgi:hypothetical protein
LITHMVSLPLELVRSTPPSARQTDPRPAVEHGPDDPTAVVAVRQVGGVRIGAQDLLHQRLVDAHVERGREQAKKPGCTSPRVTGEGHARDDHSTPPER